ncbi:Serine/threonine-protein kinase-like protein [Sesamum angolense]|uniref:Serine/threonine-protein kinase-like protein n=1 Tax=Sesamum angolense TaxID=2727404 RepID=A0AAE2C0Y4_9LAMI|nr:Serine/threonine-protein kinase-like protein [Sesamum angolense]
MKEFDLQELEVATDSFSSSRIVGKGSHGSVYGGVLKDGNHVAVKKQSLGLQKLRDNTKLENEARILSSLPPHPSLINLLGISHDPFGNRILVTEYMPNGTLHEILHLSASPLPWSKRVEFAIQIAKGVRFIHESDPSIVHRDIKSANVLVDKNWNAKLADFGLAIRLNNKDELNLPAGTIGYLDPSYTTPSKLSTKIDVFSYGVLLLELISSRKVIDVLESPASIVEWALPLIERGRMTEVLDKRVRLPRYMGGTIKQLLRMAARCLSPTECLRPSMGEIVANLEGSIVRPVRLPLSINFIGDIILKILRRKTFKFGGTKRKEMAPITCADHDMRSCDCSKKMSKGTLLVREILADFTLK